jgi:hypothetical protein
MGVSSIYRSTNRYFDPLSAKLTRLQRCDGHNHQISPQIAGFHTKKLAQPMFARA